MALRKASAYSKKQKMPYTRKSHAKGKSYIKTVPDIKIKKFVMGNVRKYLQGGFAFNVMLLSQEPVQIRHNALESARMLVHRKMEQLKSSYYFAVSAYPHHVLRENKMLTGAGADRLQTGMSMSFGTAVSRAAQVKAGGKIFLIACNEQDVPRVKEILKKAASKLPCKTKIIIERTKK